MASAARVAHVNQEVRAIARVGEATFAPDRIEVLDLANADPASFALGRVSAVCGRAAYEYIERGVRLAQEGAIAGIVTAPVNKEALAAAGVRHSGHTEILAELTGTKAYAMLLMGQELRVIHVTTHVALRRVPELVTRERVARTIRLGDGAMRDLGIARPAHRRLRPEPPRRRERPLRRRGAGGDRSGHRRRPRGGHRRDAAPTPRTRS